MAIATVKNCTFSGNRASSGDGGGISNTGIASGIATLTVQNSTLSGNSSSTGNGGSIYNAGVDGNNLVGTATLTLGNTILQTDASGANLTNNSTQGLPPPSLRKATT